MAELEIDQSNLPRVQEVCQCFAVLEDGVLAHNLQEQEIEQYYTTNVQKNQLVQNDIRVAKKLQDEEEQQLAEQSTLHRQASRNLEEQDFEYARVIQEELERCAEEARKREQDDEELAKRMQEEENQRIRRRSRGQECNSEGSAGDPALPSSHQHTLRLHEGEEQYSPVTTRWKYCTSQNNADITGSRAVSPRRLEAQRNTTSWSNQGHRGFNRHIRSELQEPLSEDSDDSDTVFSEQLSVCYQRLKERLYTAPSRRRASLHNLQARNCSRSSLTDEPRSWEEERGEQDEDYCENGQLERRRPRNQDQQRNNGEEYEYWNRNRDLNRDCRLGSTGERRCSRSESVSLHDRSRNRNKDLARTLSYKDNPDKHVHFQDDTRRSNRQQDESSQVWEMLGQVLRERGVPVRLGSNGVPLQILPQRRGSQVLHGSEVSCSDSQPHQRVFQRAATTRHSFHGDIRERRRSSHREHSGRDHREDRDRHYNDVEHGGDEISSRDSYFANRERRGSRRWRETYTYSDCASRRNSNDYRVKRTTSKHRPQHMAIEEKLSSEEEQEVERRAQRPRRRAPRPSQSLSSRRASARDRSRHMAAGNTESRSQLQSAEGKPPKLCFLCVYICSSHFPPVTV